MSGPETRAPRRAPARPYRKPVVRGEATKAQVASMYAGMDQPRPKPEPVVALYAATDLRAALLEAAGHLLDAANVIEDTGQRAPAVALVRLAAEHAKRVAGEP